MIVYGDRERRAAAGSLIDAVQADLAAGKAENGWRRRELITSALLQAGELAQSLADQEFAAAQADDLTPLQSSAMQAVMAVATLLRGAAAADDWARASAALAELRNLAPREPVTCRAPEGFAFYALDPAAYAAAVQHHGGASAPLVIGLRSIGTTLAAVAAVASGAVLVVTLRPTGEPFARELRISDRLRERLRGHRGHFLVVDEGPGLSGSSLAAAADLLLALGVAPGRIILIPSHPGPPGPMASPDIRATWSRVARLDLPEMDASARMQGLFGDIVGSAARVEDVSAGAWRSAAPGRELAPVWAGQERKKFHITGPAGTTLAKFAGLGAVGAVKLAMAGRLFEAGYAPEPLALREGFMLSRWEAGSALDLTGAGRGAFLDHLARYLAFRARTFPAGPGAGARLESLKGMATSNAQELGGPELGEAMARRLEASSVQAADLVPIWIDGRLHAWEWLVTPAGGFLKTDALDHACGHDLIGCQDVAWDLAGAEVEFGLSTAETGRLRDGVLDGGGSRAQADCVPLFRLFYCAFQAGCWDFAARSGSPADMALAVEQRGRYARRLIDELQA